MFSFFNIFMDTKVLEDLGLSKNESKIYLTLLKLGKANSAELARESGVHRINVYDVLNSLIFKGLVSYISESGTRFFKAENPEKFRKLLEEKMFSLESKLPSLIQLFDSKKEIHEVSVLRGIEGKKAQFEEIARTTSKSTHLVFTPHGLISLFRQPYKTMLVKWYKRLAEQNVKSKNLVLDTPDARQRAKLLEDIENYEVRFSKGLHFSPVSWDVSTELVFITFHTEPYLIIRIKSKEIAKAFKNSFELMWKSAKK